MMHGNSKLKCQKMIKIKEGAMSLLALGELGENNL